MKFTQENILLIFGLLFLGLTNLALGKSVPQNEVEEMQSDDYDYYSDDQSAPSQQTKPTHHDGPQPFFPMPEATVTAIVGKNVSLPCDAKNLKGNVILWYKDQNLLSTGRQIVAPEYHLDPITFALLINNAKEENHGDYYCEVLPQKVRKHTTLVVAEHPSIEAIVPESSTSAQDSFSLSAALKVASVLGYVLFVRL